MPTRTKQIRLPFPRGGLFESSSYVDQPQETTPACMNVLAFDRVGRNRGGSRPGIKKYSPTQVNGSAPVQNIDHVTVLLSYDPILDESGAPILDEEGNPLLQEGSSALDTGERMVTVVAVAGGTVAAYIDGVRNDVTGGSLALSQARPTIFSTPFFGNIYYADGENAKYYDSGSNTMVDWNAAVVAVDPDTELPVDDDGNRPTLIATWGTRIMMAGVKGDSHNYWATAEDNPFNLDYFPADLNVQRAFNGATVDAGRNTDVITAIIPYDNDTCLLGGDHTITRIRGNPADGGRIDLVSDITGIAFGNAWCRSPEGFVYFFGSRGGVYRMTAGGGRPQRLTAFTLDDRLSRINHELNSITMEWDDQHVGVRLFITPYAGSGLTENDTIHYFFDARNERWFPLNFIDHDHDPLSIHLFDGPAPQDRVIILGGQDGYLRNFDRDTYSDDGASILSFCDIGPLRNLTILELQAIFAENTGRVSWEIRNGSTLEESLGNSGRSHGEFRGGRNRSKWPRCHVSEGWLRLQSDEHWSLEELLATVSADSMTRTRIS